jgi:hypothetical protein
LRKNKFNNDTAVVPTVRQQYAFLNRNIKEWQNAQKRGENTVIMLVYLCNLYTVKKGFVHVYKTARNLLT